MLNSFSIYLDKFCMKRYKILQRRDKRYENKLLQDLAQKRAIQKSHQLSIHTMKIGSWKFENYWKDT